MRISCLDEDDVLKYERSGGTVKDVTGDGSYYLYTGVGDEHIRTLAARGNPIGDLKDDVGSPSFHQK